MRPARVIVAGWAALAIAGCGPTPPQAPFHEAQKLDSATSGIATACGETYQVTAFSGDHRHDLETLESTATTAANKLAGVYHRNPAWIYQGDTIEQIVHDGISMLRECGLHRAATALTQATQRRHS